MKTKKLSLRVRIFIAMVFLVLLASILIAVVADYQYKEETREYHEKRLERKERSIKRHLDFVIRETSWLVETEKIPLIFKDEIHKVADVHNLQVNLYDLQGELLKSSNFQSSYSYITDKKFKPLAILNLPYLEKDDFLAKEFSEFSERLAYTYIFMLLIAVALAYFLSKYITHTLKTISDKINATRLEKRNKKIEIESTTDEISTLVDSYNSMIDELEESAVKLATSEREQAWREMAKQVAHEIKNPLTPMRLTVQSFQRKFDPNDPKIHHKLDEYSKTLIQQIDTMSSIASAFSNFAKMPAQKNENLNVVKIVDLALDIFSEDYITFQADTKEIMATFDRTQLIRVVTNLVKNSIQAIPKERTPEIIVSVSQEENKVEIKVSDNGNGISEENKPKIFEPKFTTKTSGMGLGLAMVKNIVETYDGSINFVSEKEKGTTFTVSFPRI